MTSKAELETQLIFWKEVLEEQKNAYKTLLKGGIKRYRLEDRELTTFDLPELEASMRRTESKIADIQARLQGRKRARYIVPGW